MLPTPSFETSLLEFAQGLSPPKDNIQNGKAALNSVTEILKTEQGQYRIDRVIPSGSIAKGTSLEGSDFDCVLFINGIKPPYSPILNLFKTLLERCEKQLQKKGAMLGKIRTTRFSLQFKIKLGTHKEAFEIDVDLLVAANFIEGNSISSHLTDLSLQQLKTLTYIEANPCMYYLYSSALAESQINFMKLQDSFTHSMVRLCKYWFKEMDLGCCRSGVKGVLELLAVHSAQYAIARHSRSIRSAFRNFLDRVSNLPKLTIYFNKNGKAVRRMRKKLGNPRSPVYRLIPENIKSKTQFVLDPANPYNDLADDLFKLHADLYPQLKSAACLTKQKFDSEEAKWNGQMYDFEAFFKICTNGFK